VPLLNTLTPSRSLFSGLERGPTNMNDEAELSVFFLFVYRHLTCAIAHFTRLPRRLSGAFSVTHCACLMMVYFFFCHKV
jgi:hypothetical protein